MALNEYEVFCELIDAIENDVQQETIDDAAFFK